MNHNMNPNDHSFAGTYGVAALFHHEADPTPTDGTTTHHAVQQHGGVKRTAEEANELECTPDGAAAAVLAKKKRMCRYPGCNRTIKSQGHCQRHGAKAKRCKVEGCDKQAQGTHDGMCKRHWKAANFPEEASKKGATPPEPEGESVYDYIIPVSIAYRPLSAKPDEADAQSPSKTDTDPPAAPEGFQLMALVEYLREGVMLGKPAGWHRNAERRARGMFPVKGLSVQLEPWERQLALIEILLLSGGTPYANFKDLAHAWGREKGFHQPLCQSVCERKGEVERKKRSDAGKSMTEEQKEAFRSKLQKSRNKNGTSKKAKKDTDGQEDEVPNPIPEPTMQHDENVPMDLGVQEHAMEPTVGGPMMAAAHMAAAAAGMVEHIPTLHAQHGMQDPPGNSLEQHFGQQPPGHVAEI